MRIDNNGYFKALQMDKQLSNPSMEQVNKVSLETSKEASMIAKETKDLGSLLSNFRFEDGVREDKIASIQEQIERGTYNISGADVIQKLLGGK